MFFITTSWFCFVNKHLRMNIITLRLTDCKQIYTVCISLGVMQIHFLVYEKATFIFHVTKLKSITEKMWRMEECLFDQLYYQCETIETFYINGCCINCQKINIIQMIKLTTVICTTLFDTIDIIITRPLLLFYPLK